MRRLLASFVCLLAVPFVWGAVQRTDPSDAEPPDEDPAKILGRWTAGDEAQPTGRVVGDLATEKIGPAAAFEFDGVRDRILVHTVTPDDRGPLPKREFTVGGWVNVRRTSRWGAFVGAMQDNGDAERGWMLGFENDRFSFALATTGADDGDGNMTYLAGRTRFETGRWCHVVATYDGATMRLFVNGKLDAESKAQSGDVLYPAKTDYVVGAYVDADEDYPFDGWIASLEVADAARPAEAIAELFRGNAERAEYRHPIAALAAEAPTFVVQPFLQFPTKTSIRIVWETDVAATSVVDWDVTSNLRNSTAAEGSGTIHDVLIEGLEPRTPYFYRVRSKDAEGRELRSDVLSFRTAVLEDDAFAFTVVGDTQNNPAVTGRIATLCYGLRPNFQVHAGDVVGNGPVKREWVEEFFAPSWPLMSRVAVLPVLGNHERNAHWFYDYFALPDPEYRYTFDYGNARFYMVDTNKPVDPESEQYRWLDAELAKSTATWNIAVHHHPIWSSDSNDYGDTTYGDPRHRPLALLYEKHGVDVVFNGHVHMYERTWPLTGVKIDQRHGVRYITTGGSGGGLEEFAPTRTWFMENGARVHHFCYVTIHAGSFHFKAYDQEGRLFDQFEIEKEPVSPTAKTARE